MVHSLRLPARLESLEPFGVFVLERLKQSHLPYGLALKIELALEEVLTNIIHYAYPQGEGDILLECFVEGKRGFCLHIHDWGPPFNPLTRPATDISLDLTLRPIGGWGILLVRKMADELNYTRRDGKNVLTLCFRK
jgi:anti-sigma regulatory factor (Ser/Thr protein kinase)